MADEMNLRHEDRLPWLETVEPERPQRGGAGRIILLVLLALLLLMAIVWALTRVGHHDAAGSGAGSGVIAAQTGDYKIKPDDPGGLKVAGEGDSAIATSTGNGQGAARIDSRQVPETPIATSRPHGLAVPLHGGSSVTAAVPGKGGKLAAAAPVAAPGASVPGAGSRGSLVQLGAFPTEAKANAAWSALAKRFGYLASLGKAVQPAEVNGRQVFRLRVNAGSANAAADLAGRLKVAGEDCFVTAG